MSNLMRRKFRSIIVNTSLIVSSVLLCLFVFELVLRMGFYKFETSYKKSPGPNNEYRIDTVEFKTVVRTNSLNMRDKEIKQREKGEFRILGLGDSYTFGIGVSVEDTWVRRTEKLMNNSSERFYFMNAGGKGSFIGSQLEFLKENISILDPDMVIVQVFIGNDLYDGMEFLSRLDVEPEIQKQHLSRHSENQSKNQFFKMKERLKGVKIYLIDFIWFNLTRLELFDDILFKINLRYKSRGILLREYPPLESKLINLEMSELEKAIRYCREKNVKFVAMMVPFKVQSMKRDMLDRNKYDYRKPNSLLKSFFEAHDVPYIDFLDEYELLRKEEVKSFYYARDLHWTREGHEYASKRIAEFLRECLIQR